MLVVTKIEDGGKGNVSSSPAGINCGGKCTAVFQSGTSITLVATATSGQFARWTADACHDSRNPICTFVIGANTKATAKFISQPLTFIEKMRPNGYGRAGDPRSTNTTGDSGTALHGFK